MLDNTRVPCCKDAKNFKDTKKLQKYVFNMQELFTPKDKYVKFPLPLNHSIY